MQRAEVGNEVRKRQVHGERAARARVLGLNQTRAGVLLESVMTWDTFVQILKDK